MKVTLTVAAMAIAGLAVAGTDISACVGSTAQAGETPLKSATKGFENFAASVKATCH
jgi:hypothetical protein